MKRAIERYEKKKWIEEEKRKTKRKGKNKRRNEERKKQWNEENLKKQKWIKEGQKDGDKERRRVSKWGRFRECGREGGKKQKYGSEMIPL